MLLTIKKSKQTNILSLLYIEISNKIKQQK